MRSVYQKVTAKPLNESGQTMIIVILALGLFLLGAIGFGVDVANLWFHRQAAQTAADAACTAGAMDFLLNAEGSASYSWINSITDCSGHSSGAGAIAPCWYAAQNGYNSAGLTSQTPSNDVKLSYPTSVSSVPSGSVPPAGLAAVKYLQVNVIDRTKVFFMGMITGSKTMDVGAKAVCGLVLARAPVPIIVLNPTCTHPFQVSGSASISIVGGPTRSIQVNSSNSTCAAATSKSGCPTDSGVGSCPGGTINLCNGGPNFNGSSFGISGYPSQFPASGFSTQNAGTWGPATPISDPYMLTPAPPQPSTLPSAPPGNPACTGTQIVAGNCHVSYGTDGCPDHTSGCTEYTPGLYTSAIDVKGGTAIFDPGIYYITGTAKGNCGVPGTGCVAKPTGQCRYGLLVESGGVIRPSDPSQAPGDGNKGIMFYFTGASGAGSYGSVYFDANSGNSPDNIDPYNTSNATCPGGQTPPSQLNLPASVTGNVLLGQCTSGGTYIGGSSTDTAGTVRGLIFFDDRANADTNGQPSLQGGGQMVLAGNMYFHNCNSSGTGTNCIPPPGGFNAFYQLQGNPNGTTYVLGNITADELILAGNGSIAMALNPNAIYYVLRASLLQ